MRFVSNDFAENKEPTIGAGPCLLIDSFAPSDAPVARSVRHSWHKDVED